MLACEAACGRSASRVLAMAMCHELPVLPLDRQIPPHVLERRGGISFGSGSALFSSLPRLERRGGISFDRADKTALYVRMLGDVIVHGTLVTTDPLPNRRGSVPENEYKAPEILPSHKIRRTSLQTPTVAAIVPPSAPAVAASQAKPSADRGANGDQDKRGDGAHNGAGPVTVAVQQQRTNPSVLLDAVYHGQTQHMLQNVGQWNFNIFKFDEISNGRSLRLVLMHLFEEHGLTRHFRLDKHKLMKSFELIEEAYYNKNKNPYHNSMHAADVCQAMHCYLQEEKLRQALTPIEVMGALLGSAMHDLDHPGVNQKYLINSKHHLADLYQNSSVLENHHWRVGISVLTETGLLDHLPFDEWKSFVDYIRSIILATDIARQQEFLSEFQKMLEKQNFSLRNHETRKFILQIALKCADICNPCRPWQITQKWGNVVSQEFFQQGDREKAENLQVSMNCNRDTTTVPQIQCGFISFVVEPLFHTWARFLPSKLSNEMLRNMAENKRVWTQKREEEQRKAAEATPPPPASANQNSAIQEPSSAGPIPVKEPAAGGKCADEERSAKSAEVVVEPESKALKLSGGKSVAASSQAKENVRVTPVVENRSNQSAIRQRTNVTQARPSSAVLSPQIHRSIGLHRPVDMTLSDSTTIGATLSYSADSLRTTESSASVRLAMEAKQRELRSPPSNKRVKSATESTLQGTYMGSRPRVSFKLRLPPSPNTQRKVNFDDPWEKQKSPRSPGGDFQSPVGSPPLACIESPLIHRSSHPLKNSYTSPGLAHPTLDEAPPGRHANTVAKFRHGLNNNLDFSSAELHHNMSHNKQHDSREVPHWPERGLQFYSEHNSIPQRNSTGFMKAACSSSGVHHGNVMEQRTKATPASLRVRPEEPPARHSATTTRGGAPLSPPASQHARREGYSTSLLLPKDATGREGALREQGSPFIQKRMQDRGRRKIQEVPVISSGSLSPRVPPRGSPRIHSPTSPLSGHHTPTSPPSLGPGLSYSVPAALGPIVQDFNSSQNATIARFREHRQQEHHGGGGNPLHRTPPGAATPPHNSLSENNPRLFSQRDGEHRRRERGRSNEKGDLSR